MFLATSEGVHARVSELLRPKRHLKQRVFVTTSNYFISLLGIMGGCVAQLCASMFRVVATRAQRDLIVKTSALWGSWLGFGGVNVGHCCANLTPPLLFSLPFFIRAFLITSHPQRYDECSGNVRKRRERSVLVRL